MRGRASTARRARPTAPLFLTPRESRLTRKSNAPRILAGALRGRAIATPPGRATRPLRALARRSLFDVLGPGIAGARVLDLFAGAGTVGLEALSRGATEVILVEKAPPAVRALRASISCFGVAESARVVVADVLAFVRDGGAEAFDFIFLGPPYACFSGAAETRMAEVLACVGRLLSASGTLVLETPARLPRPSVAGLTLLESRAYGDTALHFFDRPPPPSSSRVLLQSIYVKPRGREPPASTRPGGTADRED
ncbi:MAG: RsmD family RNA methyltransferase [Planctomycetes bacterium]|nr:RsmD family RNA methyltransferase [Planctomycetota bacterium]